jgi:hypothetical protein
VSTRETDSIYMRGMTGVCCHATLPWIITASTAGVVIVRDSVTKLVICARDIDRNRPCKDESLEVSHKNNKHGKSSASSKSKDHYSAQEEEREKAEKKKWSVQVTCIDATDDGRFLAVGTDDGGFYVLEFKYDEFRSLKLVDRFVCACIIVYT